MIYSSKIIIDHNLSWFLVISRDFTDIQFANYNVHFCNLPSIHTVIWTGSGIPSTAERPELASDVGASREKAYTSIFLRFFDGGRARVYPPVGRTHTIFPRENSLLLILIDSRTHHRLNPFVSLLLYFSCARTCWLKRLLKLWIQRSWRSYRPKCESAARVHLDVRRRYVVTLLFVLYSYWR